MVSYRKTEEEKKCHDQVFALVRSLIKKKDG